MWSRNLRWKKSSITQKLTAKNYWPGKLIRCHTTVPIPDFSYINGCTCPSQFLLNICPPCLLLFPLSESFFTPVFNQFVMLILMTIWKTTSTTVWMHIDAAKWPTAHSASLFLASLSKFVTTKYCFQFQQTRTIESGFTSTALVLW